MTREEAIKKLGHYRYCLKFQYDWYSKDDDEALDMAIKALEQQDKILDAIKEIRDLLKQPAVYVPNYDAYRLCLSIICKHMEVEV